MVIPPDLDPEQIQDRLRSRVIGRPLEVLGEIGSTNDRIMAAGRDGAPEGLAVIADRQTAGRGRLGRSWASPPGVGLYTSILLRPKLPAGQVPLLTLVSGLAVAEAIENVTGLAPRLKWPNDLLVNEKKVGGILTETASVESRVSYVAVGIGINVGHEAQDLPEQFHADGAGLGRPDPDGQDPAAADLAQKDDVALGFFIVLKTRDLRLNHDTPLLAFLRLPCPGLSLHVVHRADCL